MRFRLILLLFTASGCAALIYETVWFQSLQLVIGASAVSLAVVLTAFMGGMCAGSLLLPRFVPPRRHPLRVFAGIEAAIGACGAMLIAGMPLVGQLYTATDGGGPSSIALRALVSLLLVPVSPSEFRYVGVVVAVWCALLGIGSWLDKLSRDRS